MTTLQKANRSPWLRLMLGFAIALVIMVIAGAAFANADPPPIAFPESTETSPGGSGMTELLSLRFIDSFINSVFGRDLVDLFVSAALGIAGSLNGLAKGLAAALATIAFLWAILQAMVERESPLVSMMEPLIFAILTALLLSNYAMIVRDIVGLAQRVIELTGTSLGAAFMDFVRAVFGSAIEVVSASMNRDGSMSVWEFFKATLEQLVVIALLIVALVMFLRALITLVSVLLLGPITVGIGIALGPLFIATLPMPYTRRWLDNWLNFMVTGAMITALVVVLLVLLKTALLSTVVDVIGSGAGTSGAPAAGSTVGKVLALVIIISSLGHVFSQIPSMADALFPGRTGMRGVFRDSRGGGGQGSTIRGMASAAGRAESLSTRVVGAGAGLAAGAAAGFAQRAAASMQAGFRNGRAASSVSQQSVRNISNATGGGSGGGNASPALPKP